MRPGHTFSSVYIQIVFAVKRREKLIHPSWENDLYLYTIAIINNRGHKCVAINGMPDHIHILVRLSTHESIAALVREIKKATTVKIKEHFMPRSSFSWQRGYSVFSYTDRDVDMIKNYIRNQKRHHARRDCAREMRPPLTQGSDIESN